MMGTMVPNSVFNAKQVRRVITLDDWPTYWPYDKVCMYQFDGGSLLYHRGPDSCASRAIFRVIKNDSI